MKKPLTTEEFIQRAFNIHGNLFSYPDCNYVNAHSKIKIKCNNCETIFYQKPNNHLNGQGCITCRNIKIGNSKRTDINKLINKFNQKHNFKYGYELVNFINVDTKIVITCPEHGDFEQTPYEHLKGIGCPKCRYRIISLKNKFTQEEIIKKFIEVHGYQFDYSKVVYTGINDKVIIICPTHGEFKQSPLKHLSGRSCWKCKSSKGESIIRYILEKNNINYIQEYIIPGAQQRFRYDFYLSDFNLLIEFHGVQHYKAIDYFGGEEALRYNKERDIFKRELAKLANIPLIEFNYKHLKQLSIIEFEQLLLSNLSRRDKIQRVFEREEG